MALENARKSLICKGCSGGQCISLTQGLDNITGDAGNNQINANLDGGSATFQETDVINGGDGTDTLQVLGLSSGGAVSVANVSNVEKFYLQSTADTLTVDFSKTGAETHVYNYNSSGAATLSNISSAAVELGVIGGAAGKTQTFEFASGNTAAAATLVVNGAAGTVAITDHSAVKTVTVKSQGTDSVMAGLTLGASVTKLNLEGDKKLDIKATDLADAIVEINAASSTGGVLVQQDGTINQKFTGGTGNDTLIVGDAATNITKDDVLNGGDGIDTITIKTAVTTAGATAGITNFEVLGLDGTTGIVSQDMDLFGYKTVTTSGTARAHVLTNVLNGTTINLNVNATDFTTTLKANTATDTQTFNIGGTVGGVTATEISPDVRVESLTINSQGTAANTISLIGTAINNIAFTGGTGLTLTALTNVTGVLDFNAMTAAVTVGSDADTGIGSVANQTVIGTSLADTFHIRNKGTDGAIDGVTVNAGAGNDTATIYAEARLTGTVVDLGAGNDTITYETNALVSAVTIADGTGIDKVTIADQANTSNVVLRIAATNSNDAVWVDGLESLGAAAGTDISFKGALSNGTGTTSAAASAVAQVDAGTSAGAGLGLAAVGNANATTIIVLDELTGDASTALTTLAGAWVDAATFATRADAFEVALATHLGTITGLDGALGSSDKVLVAFDNGAHSVLVYVTNTDTTVANTLTDAEIEVVGVFKGITAGLATQDFVA